VRNPKNKQRKKIEAMRERARRALPSILRRPEIAAVARAAARAGAEAWIVGGAARDLLLGRQDPEIDIAVSTDPFVIARNLAAGGFGTFVPLSETSPRVARLAGGRREIDMAAVEGGSMERDLARRDFTANAIAIGLVGKTWIDPFGGMDDLAAGRLRAISEENLRDDPLRVLRAARLMATHGLLPDAATTRMSARLAPLLPSAAPERIRAELEKLLTAKHVRPALAWAARAGVLAAALGGNASPSGPLDARTLVARPPEERSRLRLAILARSMAMTAPQAETWLASRRFSRAQAREVAVLLRLVDEARVALTDLEKWRWVRNAGQRSAEALLLGALLGEPGMPARSALSRRVRASRRPPKVTGGDIQEWLGIPPGPAVGEALAAIEVEGLRGAIRTRAAARRWIRDRRITDVQRARTVPEGGAGGDRL